MPHKVFGVLLISIGVVALLVAGRVAWAGTTPEGQLCRLTTVATPKIPLREGAPQLNQPSSWEPSNPQTPLAYQCEKTGCSEDCEKEGEPPYSEAIPLPNGQPITVQMTHWVCDCPSDTELGNCNLVIKMGHHPALNNGVPFWYEYECREDNDACDDDDCKLELGSTLLGPGDFVIQAEISCSCQ